MKMDLKELNDEIEKLLQCIQCNKRLDAPVYCCSNGHAICKSCRDTVDDCPIIACGSYFNDNHQTVINNLVKSFQFKCKFSNFGCSELASPDTLKQHETECDFRTINCVLFTNGLLCNDNVSLSNYGNHIESRHESYLIPYSLNSEYSTLLPGKSNLGDNMCHYRVLKADQFYFLEMIFYDKQLKAYQISVHFIGKKSDASSFTYLIEIDENEAAGILHYKYGNTCIANVMSPKEAREKCPLILFDENDRFSVRNKVKYRLKIMKKGDFQSSLNFH